MTDTNSDTLKPKNRLTPDWIGYQRLFETVGGVGGYFELKNREPRLLKLILESFGIDLSEGESNVS